VGEAPLSEQNNNEGPRLIISRRFGQRVEAHGSEAIHAAMRAVRWKYLFWFWMTLPTVAGGLLLLWT
jgi:hypothetical protein